MKKLLFLLVLCVGCAQPTEVMFGVGDKVRLVVGKRQGQVLRYHSDHQKYTIRYADDVGTMHSDEFYEYELESAEEK